MPSQPTNELPAAFFIFLCSPLSWLVAVFFGNFQWFRLFFVHVLSFSWLVSWNEGGGQFRFGIPTFLMQ